MSKMNIATILSWLLIGLIAGWLASLVMGTNSRQGMITDIVLGVLGAVVGGYVFSILGLFGTGLLYTILVATIGAVILIWLKHLLVR